MTGKRLGRTRASSHPMNRRDWLKTAGGLVIGFTCSGVTPSGEQAGPLAADGRPLDPKEVDSFLSIYADGSVTVFTSKVDVGTGMRIAMAQMAAEELGVDTARVTVVDGDTARCPNTGGTGGSTGLTRGGTAVRQAAATARHALLGLAATRLKRPAADLTIVAGEVRPAAGGRGVRIGALVGGRRLNLTVDAKAPLVPPAQYVTVGQSPARPDVPAKCTGRYQYIQDFSVPGMLHGRVIRPPAVGATLVSVDEASVARLPGVRVVRIESFLAVVSDDEWAAVRASRELAAQWTAWRGLPGHDNLERYLREGVVERDQAIVNRGP
ncbi:MAG: molybdopterin cofactor-binding domain-containing protein, partial [Gammaproteobacteria bacterium]